MKDNVYGLIERNPLNVNTTFLATQIYTGKQYIKTYSLREIMSMEGYYHIIGDMTNDSSRDQYVLRVLPNKAKVPFYAYNPYTEDVTIEYSAAEFADRHNLVRNSISLALSGVRKQSSGFRVWNVGDNPPELIRYGVEKGDVVHKADTWKELGIIIDVSRQALSNGYREGRHVMGWHVFKETRNLAKLMACLEVKQELEESIDIVQQPCYDD